MTADLVPFPTVVLDRLVALGVDVPRVLRQAGILQSRFQAPRAKLTTREFFAFWRALEGVAAARDVGLRLGAEALAHQLDVASQAALHSATLGEALARIARYKRIVCPERVALDVADGEARFSFHWVLTDQRQPLMLVDAAFASVLALARQGTGTQLVPRRIELARRRRDEALLRRHFGCEVQFDAPLDVFVLDEAALHRPFLTQNADLCAVILRGLEAELSERSTSGSLTDDVKIVLRGCMSGQRLSVEKVAGEVRMSPRTLQRRLGEVGTSYQKLLDDVRRHTARRLMVDTDLAAGEIAFILGFEELNSFSRAFHAWEGVTPSCWRASGQEHREH
ncbi:MAG TPA: AraC family transcriptional regulator ligand-binding domain-containing protein [Thermoanaerobaculia bacterium]|nr:AraC family transcriptional regulator ligand-binding domain-containing protein [Thermoanaerobaculia bacterium]